MARAQGARAQMALAFETTYGTPPAGGFTKMPFASTSLGSEQPLLNSELLGYGRDPLAPIKDAVTADEAANNPVSSAYGAPMVHVPECAAWTWDARPYPFFPELADVWTDGPNWRLGHWLTGRLGAVSLAALVRHLCLRAGMPQAQIDVTDLRGAVEGYVITALEAPRASIGTLARHFGFDAVESEGRIRFVMRGQSASTTLTPDGMVASSAAEGDVMELTRAQESELPQALKWQITRADEEYDTAQVEARRITVESARISIDNTTGIVDQPQLPRFKAWTNFDNYVGVETWTKIGLNMTDLNDQGVFDAANNLFTAPASGTYLFGAALLYKVNASTSARMRGRLVLNGSTEIRGSFGEISGGHVSLATALWLQTMVPLVAGDTVELQGCFRIADGFFAADQTSFWGCKVG